MHATFFNIGSQDLLYKQEFQSALAHGNAVGNHSYTHPELFNLTNLQARDQLLATARVQAQLGNYQTRIWRTPYQGGDQVSAGNGMFDTLVGQQLGFTEVGFTSDTSDYALMGKEIPPPPLSRDPSSPGQVVIMHDGGGNRSSTVALSVKIIREGQSDGYTFMTIPQLLAEQPGWHGLVISRGVPPTRVDTAGYWLEAYGSVFKGFYASLIRIMTVIIIVISLLILLGAAADRIFSYRNAPDVAPGRARDPHPVLERVEGHQEHGRAGAALRRRPSLPAPYRAGRRRLGRQRSRRHDVGDLVRARHRVSRGHRRPAG